jgi:HEAT repeat protein
MGTFGFMALALTLAMPSDQPDIRQAIGEIRYEQAVQNLLIGLSSDNDGLRRSSAYILGELKSDESVIPLMGALKSHKDPNTRIVAALSLCKIGDARGVFAVKQEVRFDDSEKVRRSCAWFYNQYVQGGSFEFATPEALPQSFSVR